MGEVKGPTVSDKKPSGQTSRVGRPLYENPDGSYYSEVTVTFPFEGKWLTFPSVDKSGNILSEDEVFEYVKKNGPVDPITGETFPVFETLEDAESFARDRSKGLIDFNEGGLVPEDKTPEAFGLTYEEMEKRNRDAADQMLPLPYDIEPRVNVLELPRTEFLSYLDEVVQEDTPRRDFLIREYNKANSLTGGLSTEPEEGRRSVAGSGGFLSKPEGESGLGALGGLRLEPAVGAAGIAQGLEQAITATGRSAQGLMPSEDTTLEALGVAGMATAGGIASRGSNALDFDPNQVNIFGGMGARDPAYGRTSGYLPESVGADGQYRFEIDDSPMEVVGSNIKAYSVPDANSLIKLPKDTSKLKDVMVHDEFFRQYPELGDIPVIFNNSLKSGHHGSLTTFDLRDGRIQSYLQLNPEMLLGEPELLKRVLIHEIQHAVQDREGFAGGTSSSSKEVREQAAFEIESPENVEIWNQYTKDLEDFKRPENLVAPLEAAKDFILAYSDKNRIRLRDPNFLDRLKDRFTGREESIVEGNLKVMLNSIETTLENIKSGYGVNFDHYRGGLDSLYRKLGSIVGKEDKDLFEGIVGFSPDVINPKGWGSDFDAMEYFTEVPLLPDLPAPGTDKFSGLPENLLYSIYRRKRGEVEAENAAIRAEMSLQERFDTSPEDTELTGQGIARSRQWGDPYNSGESSSSSKIYSYFDEGALKEAANQNDKSREILVDMPIDDFLEAAKKEVSESKLEGTRALVAEGTPFNSIPQLSFKNNGDGTGRVTGHEGRHRAMALREQGETTIPVRLMSEGGTGPSIRWGQQNNPNSPDYVDIIPQSLIAEEGTGSVSMPRLAAQIRQETNPREFNEGGLAMERQMNTMMAEGGIKDSGMNRDPISGNEIPAGSLAKEVRDDVDAKLSEGEYVVPADVVRYFGVNYFEKLRQKAKAGLEEMDKDGRIGGDPVGEPIGDMDEALSDEEMFALNEMFKGGFVTSAGYQEGGDVTSGITNQYQLPSSVFAPAPATAPAATPTTLYGPSGDVMVLMLPAEQERYNQLISEGYSTKPIEAPTAGGEDTGSDRDSTPSAIATPEVAGGEGFNPFSLDEEESKTLSDDPLAFGMGALDRNSLVGSRGAGVVGGAAAGPMGLLVGAGLGGLVELQDLAKARAALIVAKDKGLTDTEDYKKLEREIEGKQKGLNTITRGLDKLFGGFFSGESLAKSIQTPASTVGAATPEAIPTSGGSSSSAGMTDAPAVNPLKGLSGSEMLPSNSKGSAATTTASKPTPPSASSAAQSRIDAGGTGYSNAQDRAQKAADKLGKDLATKGRATGGLVQRPKKKPVAKK